MAARVKHLKLFTAVGTTLTLAVFAGCAFAATGQETAKGDAQPVEIEWSTALDCSALCHTRQVETLSNEECQISASHAAFPCLACHTDIEGMEKGHDGVTTDDTAGPKRLKKSEVPSSACLSCHQVSDGIVSEGAWAQAQEDNGAIEKDSVAEATVDLPADDEADSEETSEIPAIPAYSATATADVTVLTDENGTTVNPHDLPVNKSHDTIVCATCHTMHDDAPLEETAAEACTKCHHDNVYECFTCHD